LQRLHRKVAVIDGVIGFTGGINILDDFVDVPEDQGRRSPRFDFAVRIEGPLLQDLIRLQDDLWIRLAWRYSKDWKEWYRRLRHWQKLRVAQLATRLPRSTPGMRAVLLPRDNLRHRKTIEDAYVESLAQAKQQALIANSYFFPGRRLRHALRQAAQRGVRVRLLLQGRAEYRLQYWASRRLYAPLLRHGMELYEYMPSYLHAKVAVIDDRAMVGSSNMDPFSLLLAREANVWVEDARFTAGLRQALEYEMSAHCRQVTLDGLRRAPWFQSALDWTAYFLLRAAVALTGKGSEY
jgi:cardiolipin synthase